MLPKRNSIGIGWDYQIEYPSRMKIHICSQSHSNLVVVDRWKNIYYHRNVRSQWRILIFRYERKRRNVDWIAECHLSEDLKLFDETGNMRDPSWICVWCLTLFLFKQYFGSASFVTVKVKNGYFHMHENQGRLKWLRNARRNDVSALNQSAWFVSFERIRSSCSENLSNDCIHCSMLEIDKKTLTTVLHSLSFLPRHCVTREYIENTNTMPLIFFFPSFFFFLAPLKIFLQMIVNPWGSMMRINSQAILAISSVLFSPGWTQRWKLFLPHVFTMAMFSLAEKWHL